MHTTTVTKEHHGQRLDATLILLFPDTSLRYRRRLLETHNVTINGKPAKKGASVQQGDTISVLPSSNAPISPSKAPLAIGYTEHTELRSIVYIAQQTIDYAAIFKPSGMHSAHIEGKDSPSLEADLPHILTDHNFPADAVMLNRLDQLTSGMVLVARTNTLAEDFYTVEKQGGVEKLYLAVVHGTVTTPHVVRNGLDTAKRKITRVLSEDTDDMLRHTSVLPLRSVSPVNIPTPCTLVLASIHKGARHQIRAHLAHINHPIVGDPIYASHIASPVAECMYLHHHHIEFPGFTATCNPHWSEWPEWETP